MAFTGIATGVSIAAGTVGVAAPYKQQADLFKQQINQDRRLFVADYAESSWRHSESLAQAERHHAENYALTLSQYWQGDKIHRREFLQAMLMHQREVDIALRAETRENLRDELLFQNNRMNNVQLCVTVCLGVAFSVVVEGILPDKIPSWVASVYACTIGMAIMLLASSLWLSFVLIRRLNLYTAGIMHAMIDMDLKNNKKRDDGLADFDPVQTNEEFRAWLQRHCVWLRTWSLATLSMGVIMLFMACGILLHSRFLYNFENQPEGAIWFFWLFAVVTVAFILVLEVKENTMSKQKRGVYAMGWKDQLRATKHRFHQNADSLEALGRRVRDELHAEVEREELSALEKAPDMRNVVSRGAQYSSLAVDRRLMRGKTRGVIYDCLGDTWTPEEVKSQLRDVLTEVRNLDEQHATNVDAKTKNQPKEIERELFSAQTTSGRGDSPGVEAEGGEVGEGTGGAADGGSSLSAPLDRAGKELDLPALRMTLGSFLRSTLVHVRNWTSGSLRLRSKSMFQGAFLEKLSGTGSTELQLHVPHEIAPGAEIVFACRGRAFPPAGLSGEVVYTNRDGNVGIQLRWYNELFSGDNGRYCTCELTELSGTNGQDTAASMTADPSTVNWAEPQQLSDFRVDKDDDDQTVNGEVYFDIRCVNVPVRSATEKMKRSMSASAAVLQQESSGAGDGPGATEVLAAGWLHVKLANNWTWSKRWAVLTREKLGFWLTPTQKVNDADLLPYATACIMRATLGQGPKELVLTALQRSGYDGDTTPQQPNARNGQVDQLRLWFGSGDECRVWNRELLGSSPVAEGWAHACGLSEGEALEELANRSFGNGLDLDQLLALYQRIVHGDGRGWRAQSASGKASETADSSGGGGGGGRDGSGHHLSRLHVDEARGAMLLLLVRFLFEEHLARLRAVTIPAGGDKAADSPSTSPPAYFTGQEWLSTVGGWEGPHGRWHGLQEPADVAAAAERLVAVGLLAPVQAPASDPRADALPDTHTFGAANRYRFVPVRLACVAADMNLSGLPDSLNDEQDAEGSSRAQRRRVATLAAALEPGAFSIEAAAQWAISRGTARDESGAAALIRELREADLLQLIRVDPSITKDVWLRLRPCVGRWTSQKRPHEQRPDTARTRAAAPPPSPKGIKDTQASPTTASPAPAVEADKPILPDRARRPSVGTQSQLIQIPAQYTKTPQMPSAEALLPGERSASGPGVSATPSTTANSLGPTASNSSPGETLMNLPTEADFMRQCKAGPAGMTSQELVTLLAAEGLPDAQQFVAESVRAGVSGSLLQYPEFLQIYAVARKLSAGQSQFEQQRQAVMAQREKQRALP